MNQIALLTQMDCANVLRFLHIFCTFLMCHEILINEKTDQIFFLLIDFFKSLNIFFYFIILFSFYENWSQIFSPSWMYFTFNT